MYFDILHDLPGRMLVHCYLGHFSHEYRIDFDRWVSGHDGLLSASFSERTGNLLVIYSRAITRESLLVMLDEMPLFGMTVVFSKGVAGCDAEANPVLQSCGRKIAAIAVKGVLPQPLLRLCAIWRAGREGIGIVHALFQCDMLKFLWRVARFVVMTLCKNAMTIQLLLAALGILNAYIASTASNIRNNHKESRIETEGHARELLPESIISGVAI